MDLRQWLSDRTLIVCVGSGGVGKTTTAASMALQAAMDGRRVLVLTIDPAKRLANALGLSSFGNEAHRVEIGSGDGELWAMMLDAQSTWDNLIERLAQDPEVKQRILNNRIYRYVANSLAGSQEYMATEKLHDIAKTGEYDLIVLDTPPVKNALDFLESPGRLIHFFDERILKWFLSPYRRLRFGRRLLMGPTAVVWKLLSVIFGREFLDELAQFFEDFRGLYKGFVTRHDAVVALFKEPKTSFVTIFAPNESSVDVAAFFESEFERRGLPRAGFIANQLHLCTVSEHDASAHLGSVVDAMNADPECKVRVLARLSMAHKRLFQQTMAEQALCAQLKDRADAPGFFQSVPKLEGKVHDVEGLKLIASHIFDNEPENLI